MVGVGVFLFYPFVAFRRPPPGGGARPSILTHLHEYSLGLTTVSVLGTLADYHGQREPATGSADETAVDDGPSSRH